MKRIEGMRGPIKRYKNRDNFLLALSPGFISGILRFMSSASYISKRIGLLYLQENKILKLVYTSEVGKCTLSKTLESCQDQEMRLAWLRKERQES